ncbi:MAG: hypothetical protein J0H40_08645, partial [Rhizobiales bacterium]|nr:hypothetical protein [Hyphomicrobiales bacterium]
EGRAARSTTTVGIKGPPTGGQAKQAEKTTACGTPDDAGAFVVTKTRVSKNSHHAHEAADAIGRPAFRAPSFESANQEHLTRAVFDGANEEHLKRA